MPETALRQYGRHDITCFTNGAGVREGPLRGCVDVEPDDPLCDCGLRDAIEQEDPEGEQLEQLLVIAALDWHGGVPMMSDAETAEKLTSACEALVDYRKAPRAPNPMVLEPCSVCGRQFKIGEKVGLLGLHSDHFWRDSRGWSLAMIEVSNR